jgi:large subunit ribosomal protein L22
MSPDDEKPEETVEETEATVEETEATVEETPAAEAEVEATEADATEEAAAEAPAEEPVAEEKPAKKPAAKKPAAKKKPAAEKADDGDDAEAEAKPKRASRAKKPAEPKAEEPVKEKPAPARKPAASPNGRPVVKAHAKYVRTSARKARLVCDHIRGKSVIEARAILAHTPRAVAEDWEKLLNSAVANAEHNHELLGEDLKILSVTADEGPTLKRFRPRAMGRASAIRKRTSHLSIALTPKEQ